MILRKSRKQNSTPMLDLTGASDIIFTLLLFYILTQNFLPTLEVSLPHVTPVNSESISEQIITIKSQGTVSFGGVNSSMEEIAKNPSAFFSRFNSSVPVIVQVDKSAPAGVVIELMDTMSSEGFSQLNFQGIPNANAP